MRVEVLIPPSPAILNSFLYEGLYVIRSRGEDLDKVKALWEELLRRFEKRSMMGISFTGNDYQVLPGFLSKEPCGRLSDELRKFVEEREKGKKTKERKEGKADMVDLARYMKECMFDRIVIKREIKTIKRGKSTKLGELVGDEELITNGAELLIPLQIFKIDRYETITILEGDEGDEGGLSLSPREQITVYADAKALYLFLLGLLNSYVNGVAIKKGDQIMNDYFFLLFSPPTVGPGAGDVIEGRNVHDLMLIKNIVRDSLGKTLSYIKQSSPAASVKRPLEEMLISAALLSARAIEKMKEREIDAIDFRLLRIRAEDYTYKIYSETPLLLDTMKRIYRDERMVKKLENIFRNLLEPAGRFLGENDVYGDGRHAYEALRYLYMYIMTEDPQLLTNLYRELASAYKIVKNKSPGDALRYLELIS